ncbi:MAG: hypothetical protein K1X88_07395 [Nannocystaceae bacterium]|nr:hypothetical protein [Nannocystaceae bacterium]
MTLRRRSLGAVFAWGLVACGAKPPAEATPTTSVPAPQPEPAPVEPAPPPAPMPVSTPASEAAHAHAQARTAGGALPPHDAVGFVPIERAATALGHFHDALRQLAAGNDPDGKVRVTIYGSSSVAVDRYPGYLRGYLQQRFGDGGIGHVALAPLWKWHRHNEVSVSASRGWSVEHGQKTTIRDGGHLGLMGATTFGARKRVSTKLAGGAPESFSRYDDSDTLTLHYLAQPKGGHFTVALGGKAVRTISTRAAADAVHAFAVPHKPGTTLPPLELTLKGDGEVRLLGAELERDEPGVIVDSLGIGGTRAANMLRWNETEWAAALTARAPDLWILAYGANECMDEDEPIETYRENLQQVLQRFAQAAPGASCVLVGPVDFPRKGDDGVWVPRPRLSQIIEVQRALALERGCGYFDTRAWMGGEGSMDRWVVAELAKGDHLHFTKLGYLHMGRVLADALMRDFDGATAVARAQ